jgi:hypothetical protein
VSRPSMRLGQDRRAVGYAVSASSAGTLDHATYVCGEPDPGSVAGAGHNGADGKMPSGCCLARHPRGWFNVAVGAGALGPNPLTSLCTTRKLDRRCETQLISTHLQLICASLSPESSRCILLLVGGPSGQPIRQEIAMKTVKKIALAGETLPKFHSTRRNG